MTRATLHTYDIFNSKADNMSWYKFCYGKALKSNLRCRCFIEESPMRLELWGNKKQFIKYYLTTVMKSHKFDGFKRLIYIIFR